MAMKADGSLRKRAFWTLDRFKGSPVRKHLHDIEEHFADPGLAQERQDERLRFLLEHACSTTEFYCDFKGSRFSEFPVVEKHTLKKRYSEFLSSAYARKTLVAVTTSGSYGTPFTFYLTAEKKARQLAEIIYFSRWVGYELGMRYALVSVVQHSPLSNWLQNRVELSPRFSTPEALAKQAALLGRKRIRTLIAYASTAYEIAQLCSSQTTSPGSFSLDCVISYGEPLTEPMRQVCELAFGCPVRSRYALWELGVVAHECLEGPRHHLNTASYYVELLHPDHNRPVHPGETGRVVVTDLFSHGLPLIRYDTGDLAIAGGDCGCGIAAPVLESIQGRHIEAIYDPKGTRLSPFLIHNVMRGLDGVVQYQFSQIGERDYVMKMVTLPGFAETDRLNQRLAELLGDQARISVEFVASIPPLPSGKRPYIVNEWRSGSSDARRKSR